MSYQLTITTCLIVPYCSLGHKDSDQIKLKSSLKSGSYFKSLLLWMKNNGKCQQIKEQQYSPDWTDNLCVGIDTRDLESVRHYQLRWSECSFLTERSPGDHTAVSYLHKTDLPCEDSMNTVKYKVC